jgi:hypothetical protein
MSDRQGKKKIGGQSYVKVGTQTSKQIYLLGFSYLLFAVCDLIV